MSISDNDQNLESNTPSVISEIENVTDDFDLEINYYDPIDQEDKEWKIDTGLNEMSLQAIVESMIFISDGPISVKDIQKNFEHEIPLRVIHESLEKIKEKFEADCHGIRLQEIAEGFQFRTKTKFSKYLRKAAKATPITLSPATIEVLSIVAYRQPISRPSIEKIRGVDCSHIIRSLIDKKLIRISGRSEELGKPVHYSTTIEFLEHFNLKSVEDLPPERELKDLVSQSEVGEISDIKEIIGIGAKSFEENFEELNKITEMVNEIKVDTNFTKELNRVNKSEKFKKSEQNQLVEDNKLEKEEVEEVKPKTAFDLLEDFVLEDQIKLSNQDSSLSETLTTVAEYSIKKLEEIIENDDQVLKTNLNCDNNAQSKDLKDSWEDEIENAINNVKVADDFFEGSNDLNL